jgi:hypothetical protein
MEEERFQNWNVPDPIHASVILAVTVAVALPSESECITCPISTRDGAVMEEGGLRSLPIVEIKVAAVHTHAVSSDGLQPPV